MERPRVFLKDSWVLSFLSLLALGFLLAIVWQQRERAFHGVNDFIPLYSGAWLLQSGDLYDNNRLQEASREHTGMWSYEHGYIRLPFHAAFLWPLSRLPYLTAYWIWQALSLAAVCGFVALWRPPCFSTTLLFTTLSIPILHAWLKGQDIPFLLLVIALTLRLHQSDKHTLAGFVFSLCAAKFHLFLLTPVLVVGQRDRRFGAGLLGGGAALAAVSFAAGGWLWPVEFFASAVNPAFSPGLSAMPNLHGALSELPASLAMESLLTMAVILAVWVTARRASFEYAYACSLVGGLLVSHHSYMLDTAVLLPAGLTVIAYSQHNWLKSVAVLLLVPPTHFLIGMAYPYSALVTGVMVVFVFGMAWEAWKGFEPVRQISPVQRAESSSPASVSAS